MEQLPAVMVAPGSGGAVSAIVTCPASGVVIGLRLREGVGAEEFADAYGYVLSLFAPIDASEAGDSTAAWRAATLASSPRLRTIRTIASRSGPSGNS